MNGTTNDVQATPKGWPPEAHVVSVSKSIAIAFLVLYAASVGLSAWCLCELRSARAELQILNRTEVK